MTISTFIKLSLEEQFERTLKVQLLDRVYKNESSVMINYQSSKDVIDAEFVSHKIKIKGKTFVQLHKELATKGRTIYNKIALACFGNDWHLPIGYLRSTFLKSYLHVLELYLLNNDFSKMSIDFQDKNKNYKDYACFLHQVF
ncbi:hypothetical protein [Flavobacterium tegetincola]|uniref:hypothetical protein n=1 Tax=Flavobacterium tegetincola TaxID=150172 RepID=UPI0004041706|nr:hypothetical protein [Flavobacterium tegetincola]